VFIRVNPEKKRPGPVWVSINPAFLDPLQVAIVLDGRELANISELERLLHLIGLEVVEPAHAAVGFKYSAPQTSPSPSAVTRSGSDDHLFVDSKAFEGDCEERSQFLDCLPSLSEFSFKSLGELDNFFSKLHASLVKNISLDRPLVGELEHAWWPLLSRCNGGQNETGANLSPICFGTKGQTSLDCWVASEYSRGGLHRVIPTCSNVPYDYWVYGDVVAKIFIPPETKREIELIYSQSTFPDSFDPHMFAKRCLNAQNGAKLLLVTQSSLAEELRRHILSSRTPREVV
jgi:hypothetical protein